MIELRPDHPDHDKAEEAAALLREGNLVALPTETVYGLCADALNEDAVKKIYEAKGRPPDNPLIIHISDESMLDGVVASVPPKAKKLMSRFWPGPLSIVLPKTSLVPSIVTAGRDSVAIRMPSHSVFREIVKLAGTPIAAPSANSSGKPSTTSAQDVMDDISGKIPLIVDSGECQGGIESTVVSLMDDSRPILLRPGGVPLEMLEETIGKISVHHSIGHPGKEADIAESPGMRYKHYSPDAEVILVEDINELDHLLNGLKGRSLLVSLDEAAMHLLDGKGDIEHITFGNTEAMARSIFSVFRRADREGFARVIVVAVPEDGVGLALMNRVRKAASHAVR